MSRKISKILTLAMELSLLASIVLAQPTTVTTVEVPAPIYNLFNRLKMVLIAIGALIAIIFVILGGYKFMTAGGSAEKIEEAKKDIMWALVGLVVIGLAQVLVYIACFIATEDINCGIRIQTTIIY